MTFRSLFAAPLLLVLAAPPVAAQTAAEILDTAVEHYERRMADVENYTVVQETNGTTLVTYYEKEVLDGRPVFVPRTAGTPTAGPVDLGWAGAGGEKGETADGYARLRGMADEFEVTGSGKVEGHDTWVLEARDASGLDMGGDAFTPHSVVFQVDRETYIVRQIQMEGDMDVNGTTRPVAMEIMMSDYRDVEGVLHPFRTTMSIEGLNESMSAEDRAQMEEVRQQMAEMEKRLAEMPAAQRRMVEQQLEQMGGMAGLQKQMDAMADGRIETVVTEIRVNQGPPEELSRDGGRR
jgi:hypothetical protein